MAGKVGAPFGNKNGLIWTLEKSTDLLDKAIELTNRKELVYVDKQEVEAYEFDFIGEIARELNVYHSLLTRDIPNQHTDLQPKVRLLLNRLEANCYSNTKKGKINTAVGIVNLKSNHGWTDRQQIEQKQTNIDLSGLTTEEIKDLLNE
jgi:hypothetical protein